MVRIANIELGEFPILLAPMEDVSDPPFRALCKLQGCDMLYTEFISVEGLIRDAFKSMQKLDIYPEERPIGIQIFGGEIESMLKAVPIVEDAKPEVLDINYGCPVNSVVCRDGGAGILKDIPKMVALTKAIVRETTLPVTVKTRLGWDANSIKIDEVVKRLQDVGIQAISIHARTRAQMYKGEADWSHIARIKNDPSIHIPVFGNGDIDTVQKAKECKERYGPDGLMIGRASIGYPWIFNEIKHYLKTGEILPPPDLEERIRVVKAHLDFSLRWKGPKLGILEMRRHYKNYFRGIEGIKPFRERLVLETEARGILDILSEIAAHTYHASEAMTL